MVQSDRSRSTLRGSDKRLSAYMTPTDEALGRGHALRFASSLSEISAHEIASLASSNPELIGEWLEELLTHRDSAKAEADQLSRVIEHLLSAARPNIPIAAE